MAYFLLFWFAVLLVFFIPGFCVLSRVRKQLGAFLLVPLSCAIGLSLWGIQGYVFGYLHIRWATFIYVGFLILLLIFKSKEIFLFVKKSISSFKHIDGVVVALIIVGSMAQILQMIGSGIQTSLGMPFFRVNAQDGIFHLSLIESIVRQFPPQEPGAAGVAVMNYHYWSDMIMADLVRVFGFPIHTLFFTYMPILLAVLTGLGLWAVLRLWKGSSLFIRFALFFLYFGGDASYLFSLYLHQTWGFQTAVLDNGVLQFLNMPHVFAKFVFFASLIPLTLWFNTKKLFWGVVTAILFATLFGLKIYFAIFVGLGLGFVGLYDFLTLCMHVIQKKKIQQDIHFLLQSALVLGIVTVLGLIIYLPPNHGAGGLGYYPLEWPRMFLNADNLDWKDLLYRRAIYQLHNNVRDMMAIDALSILVCILCVHGTRLIGFAQTKKSLSFFGKRLSIFLIIPSFIFTFLGLYTLQDSGTGAFNVYNFFSMSISVLAVVTAFHMASLWKSKKILLRIFVLIVVVITLPRGIYETYKIIHSYQTHIDVTYISNGEQAALAYIAHNTPPTSVIASDPGNTLDMNTPYVSYFANRQTYMSGETELETHGQLTRPRFDMMRQLFQTHDGSDLLTKLRATGISYLYVRNSPDEMLPSNFVQAGATIVFTNSDATVYRLQ